MTPEQIIKRPITLTEKAAQSAKRNTVIFEVSRDSNKIEIKQAVQKLFNVTVVDVNTLNQRGHFKRMGRGYAKLQNWKKAYVTLKDGDSIDFYSETES
jgi:large subunit ribosomal protein L23